MNAKSKVKIYPPLEEKINIITHSIGAIGGLVALFLFVQKGMQIENKIYLISTVVYALCMFILFLSSSLYHSSIDVNKRRRLKVFDHAAIYLLIAGTYTPFCLVTLSDSIGWALFSIVWGIAAIGVVLKVFYAGRFGLASTIAYVVMGWIILFAYKPLSENLQDDGMFWLIAGGVSYTVGALVYLIPKIKYNHAIFHLFVLVGSGCHFISVYYYV
jgi:hemolysin III